MKQYKYKINGNLYNVTVNDVEDNIANVEVNGTSYKVELDKPVKAAPKPVTRPAAAPKTETGAPVVTKQPTASQNGGVKCPLPGVILAIKVKEGDTVTRGHTIIILAAMTMETNITANTDGKVAEITVNRGASVLAGNDLVILA